ncbi:MAG: outer membrane beta-barrel protein [Candidatus Marinimicrobia bacterium]|nr:outer membrane beta-barrel protein [Candidatus Neomarinimicrobiota bacterium]MBT3632899.1 outer membrane beta-barrel protein [Candidatus Neomarinimicrobiota bacterium]MBT3682009.1 outer membrane beta-barrel protein [Candidatus Neomarinimicrobiota bacterium]MBT3758962.1 outer membrane beta-barrel protein [Candidatus Neomarinimicrobiota bacterium]MBT3895139.1 outer membrane beta-barrel protein [Candidatus Neomarinimicrobiota bacterium]
MVKISIKILVVLIIFHTQLFSQTLDIQNNEVKYIGLGLSHFSVKSKHPSIDDQSFLGISLIMGIRNRSHVFELFAGGGAGLDVGPTYDIYYPKDSADFSSITLSYQYQFRNINQLENSIPYLGIGLSYNSINWTKYVYDHTGDGITILAGIILKTADNWAINFSMRQYKYSGTRQIFSDGNYPSYNTKAFEITGILVYHFNRKK